MVVFELDGIELDRCVSCQGTWLDAGELEQILDMAGIAPGRLTAVLGSPGGEKRGRRPCPRCGRRMRLVTVAGETPVELDQCPLGHGLWFDRGEIRATVGAFTEGDAGAVAQFFSQTFQHELGQAPKGECQ